MSGHWCGAASLALASILSAQEPAPSEPDDPAPDLHRPATRLSPDTAYLHLRAGAGRRTLHRRDAERRRQRGDARVAPPPEIAARPAGAGRYLAAVLVCSGCPMDPATVFGQHREDLLVLSSPGPLVRPAEIAALERAARDHDLSLCIVLTHDGCSALAPPKRDATAAETQLARRIEPSRRIAAAKGTPLPEAHAMGQAHQALGSSRLLAKLQRSGQFQVAGAVVDRVGDVRWIVPWTVR